MRYRPEAEEEQLLLQARRFKLAADLDEDLFGLLPAKTGIGGGKKDFLVFRRRDVQFPAGSSLFGRYWDMSQFTDERIDGWYTHSVTEIAAGYFLANALEFAVGQPVRDNLWAWFSISGKEIYKSGEMSLA